MVTDIVNPYFAHVAQSLQEMATEYNMTIVINTTHGSLDALYKILESYKERPPQLLIVQGGITRNEMHFEIIARQGLPMIGVHTRIKTIDDVWSDMRAGAQLITNHLVDEHGGQVGYISGSDEPIRQTGRFQGYRDALLSRGFQVDSRFLADTDPTYRGGHEAVLAMIDSGSVPSVLLFYNQIMAMGGMSALFGRGLKVPDDVAIASIDDSIDTSQMLMPTTTIDFSVSETAQQALQLARRRLNTPGATPMHVRIPPRLIVRQSSTNDMLVEKTTPDRNA
jgi:DNA-binding LacI/PurR family transcriptional regulator